ncbi:MAG TPA: hypothetical protein VEC99_01395, partial [Clostridia bacterium]|nr:hypothetical protein [Clostridia bacterium]
MSEANETQQKVSDQPKNEFSRRELDTGFIFVFGPFLIVGLALLLVFILPRPKGHLAIAYCAQDQVYAEPMFQAFRKDTEIRVRAVYDSEAVKTVGLANRLLAERNQPQCDVFWGNEEMRTRQLAAQNVFRETNGW